MASDGDEVSSRIAGSPYHGIVTRCIIRRRPVGVSAARTTSLLLLYPPIKNLITTKRKYLPSPPGRNGGVASGHDVCTFAPGLHPENANDKHGYSSPDPEMGTLYLRGNFSRASLHHLQGAQTTNAEQDSLSPGACDPAHGAKVAEKYREKVPIANPDVQDSSHVCTSGVQTYANVQKWCKDETAVPRGSVPGRTCAPGKRRSLPYPEHQAGMCDGSARG